MKGSYHYLILSLTLCVTWILGTSTQYFWIGLHDSYSENFFQWSDGSPLDFSLWASGQPNGGSGENCVRVEWSEGGTWFDMDCEAVHPFICKY